MLEKRGPGRLWGCTRTCQNLCPSGRDRTSLAVPNFPPSSSSSPANISPRDLETHKPVKTLTELITAHAKNGTVYVGPVLLDIWLALKLCQIDEQAIMLKAWRILHKHAMCGQISQNAGLCPDPTAHTDGIIKELFTLHFLGARAAITDGGARTRGSCRIAVATTKGTGNKNTRNIAKKPKTKNNT